MRNFALARRDMLRFLGCCGAAHGVAFGTASVSLPGWLLPQHKPNPPGPHPVVVIDPGHGGVDPGAISASGAYEKNIVFATAKGLARLLNSTQRFRVALTRDTDEFVPLQERVARARDWHADLFLSVHADALPEATMRGLSVFTLSATASDRVAAALADSQNEEVVAGVRLRESSEIGSILGDLEQRQTDNLSVALARGVVTVLGRQVALLDNPLRSAGFVVLTAPNVPSALVETGCLSNPIEERLLQEPAYQERLARGLADAVEMYFADRRAT
jgi:N-acetylmuramoyl-L-alanine amidase